MWILLLISLAAFADESDLDEGMKTLRALENELPSEHAMKAGYKKTSETDEHPVVPVADTEIISSGTGFGVVNEGRTLIRISDGKKFRTTRRTTVKYYLKEDELGFKHIIDKSGTVSYKVDTVHVVNIDKELELYEPPLRYTVAEKIVQSNYDQKLNIVPEASFYVGYVQGDFMRDLYDDKAASQGISTQYGLQAFTQWKLPVKIGGTIHYEKAIYALTGRGQINYQSLSFGPQFKTKDFELGSKVVRMQTQFRVSPFASATAETSGGTENYDFNSADLLSSLEHPYHNGWGEFVLGFYFQAQWLNIKNQKSNVSIRSSNEMNKSIGLSLSQVFQ